MDTGTDMDMGKGIHIHKGQPVMTQLLDHLRNREEILQIRNQMAFQTQIQMGDQTRNQVFQIRNQVFQTQIQMGVFFHRVVQLEYFHNHVHVLNDSRGILLFL